MIFDLFALGLPPARILRENTLGRALPLYQEDLNRNEEIIYSVSPPRRGLQGMGALLPFDQTLKLGG